MKQEVQNLYLNQLVANETPVVIFLINGFQIHGVITAFDMYCIHVRSINDTQQVIYKQAISTIRSEKPVISE